MYALRVVLALVLAGSVFVQAMMVALMTVEPGADAELADVRWPVAVIVMLGAVAVEVTAVCVWRLVTMVHRGTVLSRHAYRYVDVVLGAATAASILLLGLGVTLAPGEAVPPGVVLMIGGAAVVVAGIGMIVLLLRMVLAQAVARDAEARHLRAELAGVI